MRAVFGATALRKASTKMTSASPTRDSRVNWSGSVSSGRPGSKARSIVVGKPNLKFSEARPGQFSSPLCPIALFTHETLLIHNSNAHHGNAVRAIVRWMIELFAENVGIDFFVAKFNTTFRQSGRKGFVKSVDTVDDR